MKIKQKLIDAGLTAAVEKIVKQHPHLKQYAETDARTFANIACDCEAVEGVTPKEYWRLAGVAAGRKQK